MKKEPKFTWNESLGVATCTLTDGKNAFIGKALCDKEDQDMKSEKTGCQIAAWRAEIKYFIHIRDNEIKPVLKALTQLSNNMKTSKNFNPQSYENKMLWRQIRRNKTDLAIINDLIAQNKQNLKEYLEEKEKFYKKIRKNRKKDNNN